MSDAGAIEQSGHSNEDTPQPPDFPAGIDPHELVLPGQITMIKPVTRETDPPTIMGRPCVIEYPRRGQIEYGVR